MRLFQTIMSTTALSILDDLIETLKDGQEGFRVAAQDVQSPDLKALFTEFSDQRARFVTELRELAKEHGATKPEDSSSVAGALHRGWINLKAAITKKDDHAILAECERGEDSAVAEFKKALDGHNLPPSARITVEAQAKAVRAAHDRVRDLRNATEKK